MKIWGFRSFKPHIKDIAHKKLFYPPNFLTITAEIQNNNCQEIGSPLRNALYKKDTKQYGQMQKLWKIQWRSSCIWIISLLKFVYGTILEYIITNCLIFQLMSDVLKFNLRQSLLIPRLGVKFEWYPIILIRIQHGLHGNDDLKVSLGCWENMDTWD